MAAGRNLLERRAELPDDTQFGGLPADEQKHMKRINFTVTVEELRLLASLAADQLFRRQFIDPRMPGYKGSPEEVDLGKALVGRMRLVIDEGAREYTVSLAQAQPSKGGSTT